MVAIILPNRKHGGDTKQIMFQAADDSQGYMDAFFAGMRTVKCQCGREMKYNGSLACPECGKEQNIVGYIKKYGGWFVRTVIDIENKKFHLTMSTTDEFEDMVEDII